MRDNDIPDFCGGQYLCGFEFATAKDAKQWLLSQIDEWKNSRCMLLAVLADFQAVKLAKSFKAVGFRAVSTALNPNTANKCTLYVYKYKHSRKKVIQDITDFDY